MALARVRLEQSSVALTLALEPGLPSVEADRVGLQQVLLNLVLNGVEAMEQVDSRSRRLEIATASEGDRVRVTVRDTGVGLAGVDQERLFTAFYTTKPAGTGIGLSISRSIVTAHAARRSRIFCSSLTGYSSGVSWPVVEIGVTCGRGLYVRS